MVYVLELVDGCYYVGWSATTIGAGKRISHHFNGKGAVWTRSHRPLKLVYQKEGGKDLELRITLEYKAKYGWSKVRGAGYTPS